MSDFNYKRVVVILPERLGDSLFHTPSIRLLKTQRPNIELGAIALSTLCAEVLRNNPFIDAVHVAPDIETVKKLANCYDAALVLHDHSAARHCAEALGLPTIIVSSGALGSRHRSQNSFDFVSNLLGIDASNIDNRYALYPDTENFSSVKELLCAHGVNANDILIGCHIGCHSIAKRGLKVWRPLAHPKVWPLDNFIALEAALRKIDSRFRLVLTGSKSERGLGDKFVRLAPSVINLIDHTSVLDLAALMQSLKLFISSDTGALHVACASEVGLIALFGATDLEVTGPHPMQKNYTVLQGAELADIRVAEVIDSVLAHSDIIQSRSIEKPQ